MKYIVLLADGMADWPLKELGDRTPLQVAKTPNMDRLVPFAEIGIVKTVPEGYPPGSDVANLSVMGYAPEQYYTGRSPLEALSMGVDLSPEDIAFRCNLVTLSDDTPYEKKVMVDYSSDEISTHESAQIINTVSNELGTDTMHFYPGVSYRHLLVWHGGPDNSELTPPHDISDRVIGEYLPKGPGSAELLDLMQKSNEFLPQHPINKKRVEHGERPATSLWLWGQGRKPAVPLFMDKYGLKGSVISAVDLTKGLGIAAGLRSIDVPGATGNITTNFRGKAQAALEELKHEQDFVYIHVEAPDEAGHRGELNTKIKAIEEIDEKVLGELLMGLDQFDDYRIMVLPDHPTPMAVKTHVADPVPFMIYQKSLNLNNGGSQYTEESARKTGLFIERGHTLMDRFLGR